MNFVLSSFFGELNERADSVHFSIVYFDPSLLLLIPFSLLRCRCFLFIWRKIISEETPKKNPFIDSSANCLWMCVYVSALYGTAVGNSLWHHILLYYHKTDLMRNAIDMYWWEDFMGCKHNERSSARTKHITKLHLFIHRSKVQNGRNKQ